MSTTYVMRIDDGATAPVLAGLVVGRQEYRSLK